MFRTILAVAATAASLAASVNAALADDRHAGRGHRNATSGHELHHSDFYSKLLRPDTGTSCCNDRDCRPARHRVTASGVQFFVHGRWLPVPAERTMQVVTPDGGGHWCGSVYAYPGVVPTTYCAIVPFAAY